MTTAAQLHSHSGIGEILGAAFELYRAHAKALILTAAVVLVPVYVIHAGLAAAFLPGPVATSRLEARSARMEEQRKIFERHAQEGTLDSAEARAAQRELLGEAGAALAETGGMLAGIGAFLLSLVLTIPLTMMGTFFGTAAVLPMVDDRRRGGTMTPGAAWHEVGRRMAPLLLTAVVATVAVFIGLFLFVVPGIVLGFLFAFAAPVVMLENKGGIDALKRSVHLVMANLLPTAVVLIVLGLVTGVARFLGGLLIPDRFVFLDTLVRDLVSVAVFPLPIVALVLLFRAAQESTPEQPHGIGHPVGAH